jgi:2-(1,2-epoxy-1,2-dihydrophenyl)acetyl-CoA isomerase
MDSLVDFQEIEVERRDEYAIVRLNRPDLRNALTLQLRKELGLALDQLANDDTVRALVITGNGECFCAGGDLGSLSPQPSAHEGRARMRRIQSWFYRYLNMEKPVVCGLNGTVAGGGIGLALGADFRIAMETASFRSSFMAVGAVPDMASQYLLPRLVGLARAKEFFMLNQPIDAREALQLGLVTRVVSPGEFETACVSLASTLAKAPAALGLLKPVLNQSFETDLNTMLQIEALSQGIAFSTQDFAEGVAAFRMRRKPRFGGK